MPTTLIKLNHNQDLSKPLDKAASLRRPFMGALENVVAGMAAGIYTGTVQCSYAEKSGVKASGTVTISSGSGSIAAVINGVSISVTWATSDNNTASLLAAAINASANALVAGLVTASAATNVVTITAVEKAVCGNAMTLSATGTGATASGARLTGGVSPVYVTYALS